MSRRQREVPTRADFAAYDHVDDLVLTDDADRAECVVEGADLHAAHAEHVSLADVHLHSVDLRDAVLPRFDLRDCLITKCDLANSRWVGAALTCLDVGGSRGTGLDLTQSASRHVVFHDCRLDLALLRFASATDVRFEDCVLTGADLSGATLVRVTFQRCDLTGADVSGAVMTDVDLRTSRLDSLRGVTGLRGARVAVSQLVGLAPSLAVELGITVDAGEGAQDGGTSQ